MVLQPKVSVIIPVYNVEAFLPQCLDSVLSQTLEDVEVICVNDGSPDNCQAILDRYAQKDKRVRVIQQENAGQSSARNRGMDVSTGEYIAFVDSDDFIEPEMMEALYSRAKEVDADIAIADFYLYNDLTGETGDYRDRLLYLRLKNRVVTLNEEPELVQCIGVWDRICKRSLLVDNNIRFPEGLVYEDHLFTVQALVAAKRVTVMPDKLYYYRKFGGTSITDKEKKNDHYKEDFLTIHTQIMDLLQKEESEDVFPAYISYLMQNAFMHQGNATTPWYFKHFFTRMRDMLNEEMYDLAKELDPPGWRRYARYLKMGQAVRCWFYFKARNLVRRMKRIK